MRMANSTETSTPLLDVGGAVLGSSETAQLARRSWAFFAIALLLLLLGLLIGPRVPAHEQMAKCVGNVHLIGPFGFALNCDSPQFMELAADPSELFEPDNWRQARPGLIALAAIILLPIAAIMPQQVPFPKNNGNSGPPAPAEITISFSHSLPAYFSYVLLNILLLLSGFWVLRMLIGSQDPSDVQTALVVAAAGLVLVSNDVTKAFVWSPHTQMFNILVPLLALHASLRAWRGAILDRKWAAYWGLLIGFGFTAYAVFFVILACVLFVVLLTIILRRVQRRSALRNCAILLVLSAAPYVLWYAFVRFRTGSFFHAEVSIGEVAWMAESWSKGAIFFVFDWIEHAWSLVVLAAPQAATVLALTTWTVLVATLQGRFIDIWRKKRIEILMAFFVSLVTLGFYTCVGLLVDRLAYTVVPPLVAVTALISVALIEQSDRRSKNVFVAGYVLIALTQALHVIIKDGPWS
jgi:hypothetical protein